MHLNKGNISRAQCLNETAAAASVWFICRKQTATGQCLLLHSGQVGKKLTTHSHEWRAEIKWVHPFFTCFWLLRCLKLKLLNNSAPICWRKSNPINDQPDLNAPHTSTAEADLRWWSTCRCKRTPTTTWMEKAIRASLAWAPARLPAAGHDLAPFKTTSR